MSYRYDMYRLAGLVNTKCYYVLFYHGLTVNYSANFVIRVKMWFFRNLFQLCIYGVDKINSRFMIA